MYAEVSLTLDRRYDALAVPVSAVDNDESDGHVMLVTSEGRVEVRKVSLGLETSSLVEIRSGLKDGDFVVIGNRSALQPGQEVKPKITTMLAGKEH